MNTKIFNAFVSVLFVVIVSFFCAACTGEEYETETASKYNGYTGTKISQSLTHDIIGANTASAKDNMTATATIQVYENGEVAYTGKHTSNPKVECAIELAKTDYQITESQRNCSVVSQNIVRNAWTKSVTDGNGFAGKVVGDTCVFNISDGQVVKCPSAITSYAGVWDTDNAYNFGSVELTKAEIVSIDNDGTSALTRASYVSATLNTTYTVDLTYTEVNVENPQTEVIRLKISTKRYIISEDEIESKVVENKNREVLDETTERCSFDVVITMKSGETTRTSQSIILNRLFKGIDTYDKTVSSFGYSFNSTNGISNGSAKTVKSENGWTVSGRTDSYSANISNGVSAEGVVTSYTLYHEAATYTESDLEVVFDFVAPTVSEAGTSVKELSTDKSGYTKAELLNAISTSYLGYTQGLNETVNLYKKEVVITITGYDFRNATLVVNDNNVIASLDFITKYSDDTEKSEAVSKTFSRSLKVLSNWEAFENNADLIKSFGAHVEIAGSDKMNDGCWSWVNETRSISTSANLAASQQTNSWTSVDPNSISYTREGKTYNFGAIEFSVFNAGDKATLATSTETLDTYTYSNTINVTFGDNTVNSVAPGTIFVAKEIKGDFPAEWGKIVSAVATVTGSEGYKDWVYTWSIHFENGTLPVVVGKNADAAAIDESLFEYDTNSSLNGAVWTVNGWKNSIASDQGGLMIWTDTKGTKQWSILKSAAAAWGWNEGTRSVHTSVFTFDVQDNGTKLVVKKHNSEFATYTSCAR